MRHTLIAAVATVTMLVVAACSPSTEFETHSEPERLGTDSGSPITTTDTMDTTSLPATTTSTAAVLPLEPVATTGWTLQAGDVLVANFDGVHI
ncbi:MAG: hypothetical protein V3U50_05360, partial [Acidimicrobiia bacterium]